MKIQVPGEGPKNAKICIVGEAPGLEESEKKRPFIGSAGRKLDSLLYGAGISRDECYVTNVVKERPPKNDIEHFITLAASRVKDQTKEYLEYEEYLYKELAELGECNVIVPLGATALYAVCRKFGITKWRGSIIQSVEGRKVVPTIHPAAALRNAIFTYHIRRDLERVRKESESPEVNLPQRTLLIEPIFNEVMEFLDEIKGETAFDIEVSGYSLSCICLTKTPMESLSIPFSGKLGNYWHPEQERRIMRKICNILEDPTITKIIHNASFDTAFMLEHYGIRTVGFEDTMIAHALLWPQFPKSLAFCTSIFTREPFYKDEAKDSKAGLNMNFRQFWLYNAKDGAVTHEIWPQLQRRLRSYGIEDTYRRQLGTVMPLNYMQIRGLRFDKNGNGEMRKQLANDIAAHLRELQLEVDITRESRGLPSLEITPSFPNSHKQKKDYFFKDLGLGEIRDKEGKVTLGMSAMRKIYKMGFREAGILMTIAKKNKMKNSYLDVGIDADSRLRGSWNPVGTISGRFSCSKLWRGTFYGEKRYVGLNLQTLPKNFKPYVQADPGCFFINIDMAQAENRIVAWVGNVPLLKKAFREGIDLHALTASRIFNVPIEEVSTEPGSSDLGDGTKSQRDWGKRCNHAFNYGLGPKQFADQFELPYSEGIQIRDIYFRTYPEVESRYQAMVETNIRRNRVLENPYGRKATFLGFMNDTLFRAGYSFIPQSTVADKINGVATIPINQEDKYWAIECLLQCHDSVLLQASFNTPVEAIAEQLTALKEDLEEPIPFDEPFSIPVEFQIGLNYGDMINFDVPHLANAINVIKDEGVAIQCP